MEQSQRLTLTVKEVANLLGINLSTAYDLVYSPGFPSFRLGRRILVKGGAFQDWFARQGEDEAA